MNSIGNVNYSDYYIITGSIREASVYSDVRFSGATAQSFITDLLCVYYYYYYYSRFMALCPVPER